ncbi:hypothetical protein BJ508DRAFT_61540 [Ascobolus immersus RN42]|uniref:F-box domain-containing protein n=1 Tax=Ascobolus immersus RN42 TaxID=1160509 RepID=A0A3N4IS31_ASCIM|nr:hypothetical protein BJ508DRAFT_61540 [Ascobolus immersus RN42]
MSIITHNHHPAMARPSLTIEDLPNELLSIIITHLPNTTSFYAVSRLNKHFHALCSLRFIRKSFANNWFGNNTDNYDPNPHTKAAMSIKQIVRYVHRHCMPPHFCNYLRVGGRRAHRRVVLASFECPRENIGPKYCWDIVWKQLWLEKMATVVVEEEMGSWETLELGVLDVELGEYLLRHWMGCGQSKCHFRGSYWTAVAMGCKCGEQKMVGDVSG